MSKETYIYDNKKTHQCRDLTHRSPAKGPKKREKKGTFVDRVQTPPTRAAHVGSRDFHCHCILLRVTAHSSVGVVACTCAAARILPFSITATLEPPRTRPALPPATCTALRRGVLLLVDTVCVGHRTPTVSVLCVPRAPISARIPPLQITFTRLPCVTYVRKSQAFYYRVSESLRHSPYHFHTSPPHHVCQRVLCIRLQNIKKSLICSCVVS